MCNYSGHEFGASYPDSLCIDGQLYDADNCDDSGSFYEPSTYIACPQCNTAEFLRDALSDAQDGDSCGYSMAGNAYFPHCNGARWRWAVAKAIATNPSAADDFLKSVEPFELLDWPDEAAVLERRAKYDHTVAVVWSYRPTITGAQP